MKLSKKLTNGDKEAIIDDVIICQYLRGNVPLKELAEHFRCTEIEAEERVRNFKH